MFCFSPLFYLLFVWNSVPQKMITRFNFDDIILKEQSRQTLLITSVVVSTIAAALYLLIGYLEKINPKVKHVNPLSVFNKIGLSIAVFLVLVNNFYSLSEVYTWDISKNIFYIFFGLFLVVLGNYIYNVRPNYFVGLRLPWTLNDENNWRRTHHFAGKLWFWAGILLALINGFLPGAALKSVFVTIVVLISLILFIYSYRYLRTKNNILNHKTFFYENNNTDNQFCCSNDFFIESTSI